MDTGALLIGVAILVVAGPWLVGPFRRDRLLVGGPDREIIKDLDLDQLRVNLLANLRDLDFDYQTGKVAEADYAPLRAQLLAEAGQVFQRTKQKEQEVEDLIRARRERLAHAKSCPDCQQLVQTLDRFCPHCGLQLDRTCSGCGEILQPAHNFCPQCGAPQPQGLSTEHAAAPN